MTRQSHTKNNNCNIK